MERGYGLVVSMQYTPAVIKNAYIRRRIRIYLYEYREYKIFIEAAYGADGWSTMPSKSSQHQTTKCHREERAESKNICVLRKVQYPIPSPGSALDSDALSDITQRMADRTDTYGIMDINLLRNKKCRHRQDYQG